MTQAQDKVVVDRPKAGTWSAPKLIDLGYVADSRGGPNPSQAELYAGGTPVGALSP